MKKYSFEWTKLQAKIGTWRKMHKMKTFSSEIPSFKFLVKEE